MSDKDPKRLDTLNVYLENKPILQRYVEQILNTQEGSEDLLQETYMRVSKAEQTGKINHIRAYMFTTAKNLALQLLRRTPNSKVDSLDADGTEIADAAPNPEDVVNEQRNKDFLMAVLRDLPEKTRKVAEMRLFSEMSFKEISGSMGMSLSSVEKHMAFAVLACKDKAKNARNTTDKVEKAG
ncbi:RNA polymerase sigma factor [Porticoccus sp. GXU_MW_L64]